MLTAAPRVRATSASPSTGPSTDTAVASPSESVPLGAITVTLRRPVRAAPLRGSMMCE
jgi:hypothetical protein